jgi:bifunctional DNA-binding transcriptional regulator/antitoxin component of YhaV-PrlF toxin-antitoxin module
MKATVTVDEVGRLVLPKQIREAIGVCGRMEVKVEVVDNGARITAPETADRPTVRQGRRLIFAGALPKNWESGEAVLQMRERRLRQ